MTESELKGFLADAIQRLQTIRESITEDNADLFNVQICEKRDLEPIREMGHMGTIQGFEQSSGIVFTIIVEDNTLKGKQLGVKE